MDAVEPLSSTATPAPDTSPRPAHRYHPHRTPPSPKSTTKDGRYKRVSPRRSGDTAAKDAVATPRVTPKTTRKPSVTGRPLVPVTERRSQEGRTYPRGNKDGDGQKSDITPDGGSAGREGRHFTVANVGNNGKIYLRPTIRPLHQRYPQPNFTFPITPPGTAGLDALGFDKQGKLQREALMDDGSELHSSLWTPTPGASPTTATHQYFPNSQNPPNRPLTHRRAVSDSTIQDASIARESDSGAFKITISRPGDERRPHTMEDFDPNSAPLLDISIPSWKLGTPRFSARGTPLIRGSSYAPTEEVRSSSVSMIDPSPRDNRPALTPLTSTLPSALAIPQIRFSRAGQDTPLGFPSPSLLRPMRSTYMTSHIVIEPAMFDNLTFKPACDDRTIVRLSPSTGAVTAANPPRLVAEITSPSFLDYDLISDFFLTFRAFMETTDLLRMLVARLRWALARSDETGTVVRVRSFVAIRHWILNYFVDDFVIDYDLRVTFCELLNDFTEDLLQIPSTPKPKLKILVELKKCWRRVCAQYWDGPDFDDTLSPEIAIAPGGIAGHRDPSLDPSFWEHEDAIPPQLDSMFALPKADATSFYADISRADHMGDSTVLNNRPTTPENQIISDANQEMGPASPPMSLASLNVMSCSFPNKTIRSLNPHPGHPLAAHPIPSSSVNNQAGPVATTPKALVGKRVRPNVGHKRKNSLTDSLREHGSDKVSIKDQEFLMKSPFAGSLVRGNLLPPGQPFVDVAPPGKSSQGQRQTTVFQHERHIMFKDSSPASAMSGNGMRKLLGSVRRALSTRGPAFAQGTSPEGPRRATTNRLPGTAIVPVERTRQSGVRPPVRIDLLGAEVAEDFKKAVREEAAVEAAAEAAAEAERRGFLVPTLNPDALAGLDVDYSPAHMESSTFDSLPQNQRMLRTISDMGITTGSKSIVIVDDTFPSETTPTRPGLPTVNPSVEAFAETFVLNGADPTPPNTPPTYLPGETPRRSSYLMNQHVTHPLIPEEELPPFIPDMATLGQGDSSPSEAEQAEPFHVVPNQPSRTPGQRTSFRFHRRDQSAATHQSLNSILHRRIASFGSFGVPRSVVRSFDATTYSEGSEPDDAESPMPQPLRVIRRRPGGDLRAATNIEQLDPAELRKSRSVGSLTTYTDSLRSSYLHSGPHDSSGNPDVATSDFSQGRPEVFSLGQLAEKPAKRNLSLFSTHSSKPILRPSFEAEAQKLAQIPDDEDDGGVESALAKLEGKAPRRLAKLSMDLRDRPVINETAPSSAAVGVAVRHPERKAQLNDVVRSGLSSDEESVLDPSEAGGNPAYTNRADTQAHRPATGMKSFLSEGSQESYSSIPLLDRGLTDDARGRKPREWTNRSVLQGSDDETPIDDVENGLQIIDRQDIQHMSFDFIQKTDSMDKIPPGGTAPSQSEQLSFLNDGSTGSDLSSELSEDELGPGTFEDGSNFAPRTDLPAHPLGEHAPAPKRDATSPHPFTSQSPAMSQEQGSIPELHEAQIYDSKPLPPTPDMSPYFSEQGSPRDPTGTTEGLRVTIVPDVDLSRKYTVHLPFILAFESEILAQQFTLIEKDALNEIDWKELIDMQWKNASSSHSRSWVDFLRNTDARGVEVVIARFNIMVKWAISEVVLTQHIEERARCIIKYIHIAAHCRRYRNFATLAQLTIALSSNEVARLAQTWELVPASDMQTLHELETLVTPTRNFYNLRAEMEMGSDAGCIPFVGIYTHDLLFNAQRPSEIASSPTTAPLVNFERCRIGAAVVKTLLRLLEASTRFDFQPVEGITERCLWVGALTDDEIRRHSEALQ